MDLDEFTNLARDDQLGVIADQNRKACIFNIWRASAGMGKMLGSRLVRVLLRLPYPDLNDIEGKGVVFTKPAEFISQPVRTMTGSEAYVTLPADLASQPVDVIDWTIACEIAHILLDHPIENRNAEHNQAARKWAVGWGFRASAV
jgi:hypothetical protein